MRIREEWKKAAGTLRTLVLANAKDSNMDDIYKMPRPVIQAVGLACMPGHDLATDAPFAKKPVAAAVVTLRQRDDGHIDCIAKRMSDARDMEFPLALLLHEALVPGALRIISATDRETLGAEAMARRFFLEPRLASVVRGEDVVDPVGLALPATANRSDDVEALLCRRLSIPLVTSSDGAIERLWSRHAPGPVEAIALGRAVTRLMLWAHGAALQSGEPGPFFETMLVLRGWMDTQGEESPDICRWATSRPLMRAASFASDWQAQLRAHAAGNSDAGWTTFEDDLFHS